MCKVVKGTCSAVVLLIKSPVLPSSCGNHCRGLLKVPILWVSRKANTLKKMQRRPLVCQLNKRSEEIDKGFIRDTRRRPKFAFDA